MWTCSFYSHESALAEFEHGGPRLFASTPSHESTWQKAMTRVGTDLASATITSRLEQHSSMATPQDIAAQLGLVDPRLLLCGTASKVGMQDVNRSVAYLGGMMPGLLAVIFFSTPKLRRQWAFRILVFALIVQIARCSLGLQVSWP